jgi:hypothetical protein
VNDTDAGVLVFPAESVAMAVSVWTPFASPAPEMVAV